MDAPPVRRARQPVGGRGDPRGVIGGDLLSHTSDHSDVEIEDASLHHHDNNSEHSAPQQWNGPTPDEMHQFMSVLDSSDINYKSYAALQNHEEWNNKYANLHWRPFRNCACFILWLGWNDAALSLSRIQLQWILFLLLTLRDQGIIPRDYWIPTDASTIGKWRRWFPKPPTSMILFPKYFIRAPKNTTNYFPNILSMHSE